MLLFFFFWNTRGISIPPWRANISLSALYLSAKILTAHSQRLLFVPQATYLPLELMFVVVPKTNLLWYLRHLCVLSAFSLPFKTCLSLNLITCQLISQSFFSMNKSPNNTVTSLQLWPADGSAVIFRSSGLRATFSTAAALSRCCRSLCPLFEIWARTSRPLLTVPAPALHPPLLCPISLGTL